MKIIHSKMHGVLDYLTVVVLLVSPTIFQMQDGLSHFTYWTAIIQFILSICTRYEWGLFRILSFPAHGFIECIAAILFVLAAFFFRHAVDMKGFYFCLALAIVYFVVFTLTDFTFVPAKDNKVDAVHQ